MGGSDIRLGLSGMALALAIAGWPSLGTADVISVTSNLDFSANQSFWGPGGSSADFNSSGRVGTNNIGVSYSARASTGNVTAAYNGALRVSALDEGARSITIDYIGDPNGGSVDTFLGASLSADLYFRLRLPFFGTIGATGNILSINYGLGIDTTFTPTLGQRVTGQSNDLPIVSPSVGIGLISAGIAAVVDQGLTFWGTAIQGNLVKVLEGVGYVGTDPFLLTSDHTVLPVDLDQEGAWDLTLTDLRLVNIFTTGFDLSLDPFIKLDLPGRRFDRTFDFTAASFDLYDARAFALDFNEVDDLVTLRLFIDEPPTLLVYLAGIGALVLFARRGAMSTPAA